MIRGTRIMVKNILGMIAGGYTLDQVLQAYPELTSDMVDAALQYAVTVIDGEVLAHANSFPGNEGRGRRPGPPEIPGCPSLGRGGE